MLATMLPGGAGRSSGRRNAPRREGAFIFKAVDAVPSWQDSPPTPMPSRSEEAAKKLWLEKLKEPLGAGTSARPNVKRGKVKFYKQDKGWGIISPEKKGEIDVFVHYSSIKKEGWRSLKAGEPVEYTVVVQSDGRVACGTVTGPDGADVQGYKPERIPGSASVPGTASLSRVTDWMKTVDGVVIATTNPLIAEYDKDDIFDDTFYLDEEDYFSN